MYELEDIIAFLFSRFDWVIPIRKAEYLIFLIQYEKRGNKVIEYYYEGRPITRLDLKIPLDRRLINYLVGDNFEIDTSTIPNKFVLINRYVPFLPIEVIERVEEVVDKYSSKDIDELKQIIEDILKTPNKTIVDLSSCKTFL